MKRSVFLGAVSAMALIAPAQAANLSTTSMKETVIAPPLYTWAGFYIGANGGYAWNSGGESVLATEPCGDGWVEARGQHQMDGGFGGGQIGFNIQRDQLVYGLEADIQGADVTASSRADPSRYSFGTASSQLDWFATIRGRLGLAAYQNWLVYATGGVAFGGIQDDLNQNLGWDHHNSAVSRNDTFVGYVLGAGVEYAWSPAWSVKFEYQFMDLGSTHLRQWDNNCACFSSEFESKQSFNTARIGINYHLVPQYVPLK